MISLERFTQERNRLIRKRELISANARSNLTIVIGCGVLFGVESLLVSFAPESPEVRAIWHASRGLACGGIGLNIAATVLKFHRINDLSAEQDDLLERYKARNRI